jgi:hypothetical protein
MNTTRHAVDFPYTRQELEALFCYAHEHDVEKGGIYDPWPDPEPDSTTKGTFYVRWTPTPTLWQIDIDEGFSFEDLMQELGRLELQALGRVKHGDVPRDGMLP